MGVVRAKAGVHFLRDHRTDVVVARVGDGCEEKLGINRRVLDEAVQAAQANVHPHIAVVSDVGEVLAEAILVFFGLDFHFTEANCEATNQPVFVWRR